MSGFHPLFAFPSHNKARNPAFFTQNSQTGRIFSEKCQREPDTTLNQNFERQVTPELSTNL